MERYNQVVSHGRTGNILMLQKIEKTLMMYSHICSSRLQAWKSKSLYWRMISSLISSVMDLCVVTIERIFRSVEANEKRMAR